MEGERPPSVRNLPRAIGRYEILGRLGKGAMGVVYSAHDNMMERSVAIKVMMTDLEDDPETSSRFYREARSAGQLVHPNIVTIFDMGQDNGRPFIVMEFLEGETLNKYLARPEAADLEVKIELMVQICQGLHAAHSHGIFHRDIKPGNLLVRSTGELKIVDFGIARLASSSMTASGLIMGTPDYMSPEQARGHDVDQRSDIFSAGAVFYYILTGRKPFAASELTAVLMKVQTEEPLPIRDAEAPATLTRIVMRALAKSPADRYQTCARMAADLEHLERDLETEARQWLDESGRRLQSLEALSGQRRALIDALDIAPRPPDIDPARPELVERHAAVSEPLRRYGDGRAADRGQGNRGAGERGHRSMAACAAGTRRRRPGDGRRPDPRGDRPSRRGAAHRAGIKAGCRRRRSLPRHRLAAALPVLGPHRSAARRSAQGRCRRGSGRSSSVSATTRSSSMLNLRKHRAPAESDSGLEEEAKQKRHESERALERADAHRRKGTFRTPRSKLSAPERLTRAARTPTPPTSG